MRKETQKVNFVLQCDFAIAPLFLLWSPGSCAWGGGRVVAAVSTVWRCLPVQGERSQLQSLHLFALSPARQRCLFSCWEKKSTCSFLAVWATRWLLYTDRVLETLGQETESSLYSLYKWLISFSVCSCFIISKLCHGLLMSHVYKPYLSWHHHTKHLTSYPVSLLDATRTSTLLSWEQRGPVIWQLTVQSLSYLFDLSITSHYELAVSLSFLVRSPARLLKL